MSGTLPTRINLHRGDPDQTKKKCRHCRSTAETDMHILNVCHISKDARSKRHNLIAKKIGKELTEKSYQVWLKKTYMVNQERMKPDITAMKEGTCYFIEITCPYEKTANTLKQRETEKEEKYRQLTINNIQFDPVHGIVQTKVIAIVIGSAGTITKTMYEKLKRLGIGYVVKQIQMIALMESTKIWKIHNKT